MTGIDAASEQYFELVQRQRLTAIMAENETTPQVGNVAGSRSLMKKLDHSISTLIASTLRLMMHGGDAQSSRIVCQELT